jgi:hypothetical protein
MWRSNNFFSASAPTWLANGPAYSVPSSFAGSILSIAFSPSEPGCTSYAYGNRSGEVFLTRNSGASWTNLDSARTLPARAVNSIAFDPSSTATAYVALSSFDNATPGKPGHVFKTSNALDAAPTWRDVSPAADVPFNVLAVDPRDPNLIYAGSDTGLWKSADGGTTWSKQGLELGVPNVAVYDIQINPATDRTVVFTYGRGAYRLVTTAMTVRPPTNLRVDSVVGNSVTVSFKPPVDGVTPTGFVLEGGAQPGQVLATLPIAVGASRVTFAAPTGAFYVRVHTFAGGLRSGPSNEERVFVNVPVLPGRPTNLLYAVDGNTLALAWMNNASGGALARNHLVVRGALNSFLPISAGESITFTNVPAGTYDIVVHGVNGVGDGPNSNSVRAVIPGPCTGIPAAPVNVTATKSGSGISLVWDLPVSGPAPTSFVVNVTGSFVGSFPVTARTLSGTVGPGSYAISVSSRNSCGSSSPSAPQTVVVP